MTTSGRLLSENDSKKFQIHQVNLKRSQPEQVNLIRAFHKLRNAQLGCKGLLFCGKVWQGEVGCESSVT